MVLGGSGVLKWRIARWQSDFKIKIARRHNPFDGPQTQKRDGNNHEIHLSSELDEKINWCWQINLIFCSKSFNI